MISSIRRAALTSQAEGYERNLHLAEDYLLDRGISEEAAQMFRLGVVTEGDFAVGRLAVPYWTPAGVVNIKFRCMKAHACKDTGCKKYLFLPGLGQHLYNAQVLPHVADTVVVTEGELDAICVQAYAAVPAVAFPGADSWTKHKHWRYCFEGIAEVIVVADGDDVGRTAAKKVAESIGMSARVVELPDGYDANQFIEERKVNAFQDFISR